MRFALMVAIAAGAVALAPQAARAEWCQEGTTAMLIQRPLDLKKDIQDVLQKCKPGDTVAFPADMIVLIGTLCDFTKTIYSSNRSSAICVIKPR